MRDRLPYKEVKKYIALLPEGEETRRFNHVGCASTTSSRSLQIWRKKNGYDLYCFKCNKFGGAHTTPLAYPDPSGTGGEDGEGRIGDGRTASSDPIQHSGPYVKGSPRNIDPPGDRESRISHWAPWAISWVGRYGLNAGELKSVTYSSSTDQVIFELISSKTGYPRGYQARLSPGSNPKYLSFMSPDSTFIVEHKGSDTVCLVEDCLSAIKVGRYVTAIALLSSNYREHLSTIIARHDRVIVFLDNDNPTVQREARKIYLRVELLVKDVKLIRATKDPKDHTDEELRDFLL